MNKLLIKFSGKQDVSEYVRILVVGYSGSRRTDFALTAENSIWGLASSNHAKLAPDQIPFVELHKENDLFLLKEAIKEGKVEADTLVIDRVEEFQRRILIERLISQKREFPKSDDWNWLSSRMNIIFEGLSELPINIIYLSALKDLGGFDDQPIVHKPAIVGAFGENVYDYVDYAVHIDSFNPAKMLEAVDKFFEQSDEEVSDADRHFLAVKGNSFVPWTFDITGTLGDEYELSFEDDFKMIKALRAEFLATLPESKTQEILFAEVEDDEKKDTSVPGMSNQKQIADLLNKGKPKAATKQSNKEKK